MLIDKNFTVPAYADMQKSDEKNKRHLQCTVDREIFVCKIFVC